METLGYNKSRLLLGAAAGFVAGAFFLWVITDPSAASWLRGPARLLTTSFGQFVFGPFLMFGCFACTWRFSVIALGHGRAVEAQGGDLVVHTVWGPRRFRPGEIESVSVEQVTGQSHLVVLGGAGGLFGRKKARLVLGLTELAPERVAELIASIERLRVAGTPMPAAARLGEETRGFDADDAIARYLARKEASGVSADPTAGLPAGPRPVFGRKRV